MEPLSEKMIAEIDRRVIDGGYDSAEELIAAAFTGLDSGAIPLSPSLEQELLKGLEGEEEEVTPKVLDAIQEEILSRLHLKRAIG